MKNDVAARLFTYLCELVRLRAKAIRSIEQYESHFWFSEIPREKECFCVAWQPVRDDEPDSWLQIKKPSLKPLPAVPEALKEWVNSRELESSSVKSPTLRQRIAKEVPGERAEDGSFERRTEWLELKNFPEIESLWRRYVNDKWGPWAEEDRRLRKVQQIYTDAFSMYQKQQALGEAYEVVLGVGYLTWRTPKGYKVNRHIMSARVNLTFDPPKGLITVIPAQEGVRPTLEEDMLEPGERPRADQQRDIEKKVAETGAALWHRNGIQETLKAYVHGLSAGGQFDDTLEPQGSVGDDAVIHLAPAVILRRRTERGLVQVFKEIERQLREGQPVPPALKQLLEVTPNTADPNEFNPDQDRYSPIDEEIYFPGPANKQQRSIVKSLSRCRGVLVQGPPGTGKSETIANLVCHLIAMGQRVLVTSHTARALRVLRKKLPGQVAELCVLLLGDDRDAFTELERSVMGITGRYHTWNREENDRRIDELKNRIDQARRKEADTLRKLREVREAETYPHSLPFGGYKGTAQVIANRIRQEENTYSWLCERPGENVEPPLSDTEAKELLCLLREDKPTRVGADPDSLVTPRDFLSLVNKERDARARYEAASAHRKHPAYPTLASANPHQRRALVSALAELISSYESVASCIQPWARKAAAHILGGQQQAWRQLLEATKLHLEVIGGAAPMGPDPEISGLPKMTLDEAQEDAAALLGHLQAGGKLGWGPFRPKVVKSRLYLIKEVRVDGYPCSTPEALRRLLEWIQFTIRLGHLREHWSQHTDPPSGTFTSQVAEYKEMSKILEKAVGLHEKAGKTSEILRGIGKISEPTWYDLEELRSLQAAGQTVAVTEQVLAARRPLRSLGDHLEGIILQYPSNAHPSVKQAYDAVQTRDVKQYAYAYQVLCNLERRRALLHRLREAAPKLASEVEATYEEKVWDARMAEFTAAWNWARADTWLRNLSDPETQERLSHQLDQCRCRARELICELAAAKAWGHCFSRLTEDERQHLIAWQEAMKKVGKGTGRHADKHRKQAREHMEKCRSAIPAWIMPIYRVAETLNPMTDAFDVAIIDEASQSGPEALFLLYIARKRIVVVGDDKQIAPDFVGVNIDDVDALQKHYIPDVPFAEVLGNSSFFAIAMIKYGEPIRLREHFRCMPEIIQFSNNLCYRWEPLIPLRQYGAGRLTPVIKVCHVSDGYQEGQRNIINPPEAQAVVDQIKRCCEDRSYDGKSMGVISLLGDAQARKIETLLLRELGPEEMEKRNLICGDAYAFQGDERDIIFLSMVSAPTEGKLIGVLAHERDERRFNVAASRAKDQMWLFHTATLNDLSKKCVRFKLLEYCLNPSVGPIPWEGIDVRKLREAAASRGTHEADLPSQFDSWFEVDIFLKIYDRGYRVIPQYQMMGYRIDLLVEGVRGRLAVECDGDTWHGPEQYESDMGRQRDLERCGLPFWRVRGSTFYRDPDNAPKGLWSTLARHNIFPGSREEHGDQA